MTNHAYLNLTDFVSNNFSYRNQKWCAQSVPSQSVSAYEEKVKISLSQREFRDCILYDVNQAGL